MKKNTDHDKIHATRISKQGKLVLRREVVTQLTNAQLREAASGLAFSIPGGSCSGGGGTEITL